MKQVVLGAGPLGTALAGQLRDAGHDVDLVSVMGNAAYDMPSTQPTALDGADPTSLREVCDRAEVVYPLLDGKRVSVLGNVAAPHTYAYVDDVARGLALLASEASGRDPAVPGRAWHIPAAPTVSHRELLRTASEEAGVAGKIRGSRVSGYVVRGIGLFQKDVGEVSEILYESERPLEVSHRSFAEAFDFVPTPHREALRVTLGWYRDHPEYR